MLLLNVLGKFNCRFDVTLLRRFISAGRQQKKPVSTLRVIDAIPRSEVNLQLGDTVGQIAMYARIAMNQPVNADLYAGSAGPIPQRVDPLEAGFCLFHTHTETVAYGLRLSI